jgi:hypothetical protein
VAAAVAVVAAAVAAATALMVAAVEVLTVKRVHITVIAMIPAKRSLSRPLPRRYPNVSTWWTFPPTMSYGPHPLSA